jgi:hypothetical protein
MKTVTVPPGYRDGYRMLKVGEVYLKGDEMRLGEGVWAARDCTLGEVRISSDFPTRRKLKPAIFIPAGYRELKDGEIIEPTDKYLWGQGWVTRACTRRCGHPYKSRTSRVTIRAIAPSAPKTRSHTECLPGGRSVKVIRGSSGRSFVHLVTVHGDDVRFAVSPEVEASLIRAFNVTR